MVKKDPASAGGLHSLPILEGEIADQTGDFISFGAVECDDYICVRDADFVPKGSPSVGERATGYCSRPCSPTSPAPCTVGEGVTLEAGRTMSCRALILDEQTLSAICNADPQACRDLLGGSVRSSYYCVQSGIGSGTPDAGT